MTKAQPTAKNLILSLLRAVDSDGPNWPELTENGDLSVEQILRAAALFDIDPQAARMSLSRLVNEGFVAKVERGLYRPGKRSLNLNEFIGSWRNVMGVCKKWTGMWTICITTNLGRADRTSMRNRERILKLFGFAEAQKGIWVRPANLNYGSEEFTARLYDLGLPSSATFLHNAQIGNETRYIWTKLWNPYDLTQTYSSAIKALQNSYKRLPILPEIESARESFLLGQSAISIINTDPLLPDELLCSDLFAQLHKNMLRYDRLGRKIWKTFLEF